MSGTQALVLAGHGSQRHARSAAPVHAHADRIRAGGGFHEVRTAFWKEEPTLGDVATTVESDVAYVVPVLTSEGYFADEVFPRELDAPDDGHRASSPDIRYTEPAGTHPAMTAVVEDRVEVTRDGPAEAAAVVVVGHGTERNERSADSTRSHADRLRDRGRYAEVEALFLDEPPYVDDALEHVSAPEVVLVPLFVADGYHTTADVPAALGHPGVGETAVIDGRRVHYTGAVGTEPSLADVIVERAVEAGASPDVDVPSPRLSPAESEFVRRLRDGPVAWGELSIDITDGGFLIRHRADANLPSESLASVDGPSTLRERVRHDDDGRYRPLSGAETLPTGWELAGLDTTGLVRAVRAVYPGSIAHWYRDRSDQLVVTDFRETVDRQTGIYADLDRLSQAELDAATEAVCGGCVRSRRWGIDDGEDPDAGGIPCREACPFFLSAAHAFLDSGRAAAELDSEVPAGAFEDPANRYRVEYSRAIEQRRGGEPPIQSPGGGR